MRAGTAVFLLGLVALFGALAAANGGTLRLANAVAGPYLVSVWTERHPRPGPVDTSVALMRPESHEAVLDARVDIVAELVERTGPPVTTTAVRGAGGNLLLYHAELQLPAVGRWRIRITGTGRAGTGTTQFDLVVATSPVPALAVVAVAVAVGLGGWLLWRSKRTRRRAGNSSIER